MPLMKGVMRLTGMTVLQTPGNSRYFRLIIILMLYLEAVMEMTHCCGVGISTLVGPTDKPISLTKHFIFIL